MKAYLGAVNAKEDVLLLSLPAGWLQEHPLMRSELESEIEYQHAADGNFNYRN